MKDHSLARANDNLDDLARVQALLLDALAMLDRNPMPTAVTAAALVSHALEVLSPGADPFELPEPEADDPSH